MRKGQTLRIIQYQCIILIMFIGKCATNNIDDSMIIRQLIHYSQYDNSLESNSCSNLDNFIEINKNKIIEEYIQNKQICSSLNLTSNQCYQDCIYYLSPLSLILNNTNNTNNTSMSKVLKWYQMGGGPIGWYETGNPDMCSYVDGTYCYTPIVHEEQHGDMIEIYTLQAHGCCVPGSCIHDDAIKVLQQNNWCYKSFNQTYNALLYPKKNKNKIKNICHPIPRNLSSAGFCSVCAVFCIFLVLVIVASIRSQYQMESKQIINNDDILSYCFSIQNSWKMFIKQRHNYRMFNFFDGIRVISMAWVIWGHSYAFFLIKRPSNEATFDNYAANQFYSMFSEYSFYSVDTFFFLSGFLGSFSLINQLESYGNNAIKSFYQWIPLSYLTRILRIFPMMMFAVFVQWFVAPQLSNSYYILARKEGFLSYCSHDWYQYMLFIANLYHPPTECLPPIWYLQNDMQMFLLLPWIVLIFKWNKIYGLISSLIPFFVCIIVRAYFAFYHHFSANIFWPALKPIHGAETGHDNQYYKPWNRMGPYFIGIFIMFVILMVKDRKVEIRSRAIYFSMMCLAGFILSSLVFWPYDDIKDAPQHRWGLVSNAVYWSLSRPSWGVGLALMTVSLTCKSQQISSFIATILSAGLFQPIGKLSYSMYLFHWIVIQWFYSDLNMPLYYQFWWIICIFFCMLCVTMILALILWFVMEQPMSNLVKLFLKWLKSRKDKLQQQPLLINDGNLQNDVQKQHLDCVLATNNNEDNLQTESDDDDDNNNNNNNYDDVVCMKNHQTL